jgi:hypothetical protein
MCVSFYTLIANTPLIYSGVHGYFCTVTNDEEDIVTTTIMHLRSFNLETMDNRIGASGLEDESVNQPPLRASERHGFKHVVRREEQYGKHSGQPVRPLGVNGGDTDRPRVSIHDL